MIDLIVGLAAALLIGLGLVIIAGPALPRAFRALVSLAHHAADRLETAPPASSEPAPALVPAGMHPSSQRALQAAARIAGILRVNGRNDIAAQVRSAARKLPLDEASGVLALGRLAPRLARVRLDDEDASEQLRILAVELRVLVNDRAEQLELLPFK